jgi:predicted P-loop ATPase
LNKHIFNDIYLKSPPQGERDKYMFLVSSKALSQNIIIVGFRAVALIENDEDFYNVGEFVEALETLEIGTYLTDYIFVLCGDSKRTNDSLDAYMNKANLAHKTGWRLFHKKEYLENSNYQDELKHILQGFLDRQKPPRKEKRAAPHTELALLNNSTNSLEAQGNEVTSLLISKPTAKGEQKIQQLVKNWEIVLENDSRFSGKVRFDEFSRQLYLWGEPPWESKEPYRPWQNSDDAQLYAIIQNDYGLNKRDDYYDSISNISQRHKFHQVRDVLESIPYEGEGHIRRLLPDYLGAQDTDYNFQIMRLMMLGGVARVYQAGAKFDYCTILEGRQGLGKSTFLRLLALDDSFFNDSLDSLDSTTAVQGLLGSWVIELAELKSLGRTSGGIESVKRFLSATSDKIRLPYQRRSEIFPRQCIFFGTTNSTSYLDDATGNRRFLIVRCGENEPTKSLFSQEAVEDFRRAWAEAVHIYKMDKPKLVLSQEAAAEAAELAECAKVDDGMTGLIVQYLDGKDRTCSLDIWLNCLNEDGRPRKSQSNEINNIVANLPDWERTSSSIKFDDRRVGVQRGFIKKKRYTKIEEDNPFT